MSGEVIGNGRAATGITDGAQYVEVDDLGRGLVGIDFPHHEIHKGDMYSVSDVSTIASGGTLQILIDCAGGDKDMHTILEFDSAGETQMELYENPTVTTRGVSVLTPQCQNRYIAGTPSSTFFHSPTVSAAGTRLFITRHGVGKREGGSSRGVNEWILARGGTYLVRVTDTSAAANWCATQIEWYREGLSPVIEFAL